MQKFSIVLVMVLGGYLLPLTTTSANPSGPNVICDQRYALCTSAPCIPDPLNPDTQAVCRCTVQDGKSFGNKDCPTRAKSLTSNYSFVEYSTNKTMICPAGDPWTFCLDRPCTADPMDPKRAICSCEIRREERFVTLGGNCDTGSCKNAYWSGATLGDVKTAETVLAKELGLSAPPKNQCSP